MPICIRSVVCKILEIIVKAKILKCLKLASLFSDTKHDFAFRRSCPALFTCMTNQIESEDFAYFEFSKAFASMCHRLLVKKMVAMGTHLKKTHWVEKLPKNVTLKAAMGFQLLRESACLRAPSVHHRFKETTTETATSSSQQALNWPRRWYLPLIASKSHHLSLEGLYPKRLKANGRWYYLQRAKPSMLPGPRRRGLSTIRS